MIFTRRTKEKDRNKLTINGHQMVSKINYYAIIWVFFFFFLYACYEVKISTLSTAAAIVCACCFPTESFCEQHIQNYSIISIKKE